ncbi:cyclase family protein, partial [candidate division KSB1 bacterium]
MAERRKWTIRTLIAVIVVVYIGYTQIYLKQDAVNEQRGSNVKVTLSVIDKDGEKRTFTAGQPVPVDRRILFRPDMKAPNAFSLPPVSVETFAAGDFTADVDRDGVCNVEILSTAVHNVTHFETSSHVLSYSANSTTVDEVPADRLSGLLYVVDLTDIPAEPGRNIAWSDIESRLERITLPVTMLALKTQASLLPEDTDFS